MKPHPTIDAYIASFPEEIQAPLRQLRSTIRKAAPAAQETIRYGIPTYLLNGHLVHFAAYKKHIGFYPTPSGVAAFTAELTAYHCSKGAIQFPHHQSLPLSLITKIVKFRVQEALTEKERKKKQS